MNIDFTLIGNATWVLNIDDKIKIGCDPTLAPSGSQYNFKGSKIERVLDPIYNEESFKNIPLWLLTHNHFDHLDEKGVKVIEEGAKVYSIKNCSPLLKHRDDLEINYLKWLDEIDTSISGYNITVKAVPAFHGKGLLGLIVGGRVNGYLLTIKHGSEKQVVYITSDSIYNRQIKEVINHQPIDLMIINMGKVKSNFPGGPYTADIQNLELFRDELKPSKILPIHIDDFSHFETRKSDLEDGWKILNNGESIKLFKNNSIPTVGFSF